MLPSAFAISAFPDYLANAFSAAAAFLRLFLEFLEPKKLQLSRYLVEAKVDLAVV